MEEEKIRSALCGEMAWRLTVRESGKKKRWFRVSVQSRSIVSILNEEDISELFTIPTFIQFANRIDIEKYIDLLIISNNQRDIFFVVLLYLLCVINSFSSYRFNRFFENIKVEAKLDRVSNIGQFSYVRVQMGEAKKLEEEDQKIWAF